MNKKIMDMLLISQLISNGEYESSNINDEKVLDCIMDMYFYMLYNADNNPLQEKYLDNFNQKYNALTKKQQKLVKQEYIDIIETQNKNREKVKRKGMNNYE